MEVIQYRFGLDVDKNHRVYALELGRIAAQAQPKGPAIFERGDDQARKAGMTNNEWGHAPKTSLRSNPGEGRRAP